MRSLRHIRRAGRAGLTLMEVMIVIALMAALMVVTAYGLGFIGAANVQGESLRFSGVIRYVYNEAATQNRTLQLVIDLDKGSFYADELDVVGAMTTEEMSGANLHTSLAGDDDETFASLKRGERIDEEDEQFSGINRERRGGALLSEEDSMLQEGVHFVGVMTSHHEEIQWEGTATINFFPAGFVERTILYIGDDKAKASEGEQGTIYSLLINPLTGQSTLRPGKLDVDKRFFAPEED